jgi:hypothetical protein
VLLGVIVAGTWLSTAASSGVVCYDGGGWFHDGRFDARTACVVEGHLRFERPNGSVETVNLAGRYVVPPFGEAHNHNVEISNPRVRETIQTYLERGIFYVKNPSNLRSSPLFLGRLVNHPGSIDVSFSQAGITSTGGHPGLIVRRNLERKIWTDAEAADGAFIWTIDSEADLTATWPRVLAARPDFIKIMLLYSDQFERRTQDPKYFGWSGLNPALLPLVVQKAHQAGLRASAHVETGFDFEIAVRAGVDEISHLPGFRMASDIETHPAATYEIRPEAAAAAAKQGVTVVTTIGGNRAAGSPEDKVIRHNLQVLKDHRVRLALGSDSYSGDTVAEALSLHSSGLFSPAEILAMWCQNTALTILPARRIGSLQEGFEASFLVLDGNPLDDFSAVTRIVRRVKQGVELTSTSAIER